MNKRCTCEIIITVRGGVVQEVRSTIPCTNVCIADYDIDYEDSEHEERLNDIEERANQPGMYIVY